MMSRKAFQQLMADFKRVGSHIVFASPTRLLLQTTKAEVGNAYAYSQYIVKSIKAKPLFNFLDLSIREYWDYLVWYDDYNYGGKATQEVVEAEVQPLDTIMHWQLATFLPPLYKPIFDEWAVKFIELMHKLKRPQMLADDSGAPRLTQIPIRELTSTQSTSAALVEVPESTTEALNASIGKPLRKKLVSLISQHRAECVNPLLAPDHEYPSLPGSHLDLTSTNPVLQLTKSLMHVYGLDRSLNLPVRALRKDLLSLFDVKEFSAAARFEDPSRKLALEWSCSECTMVRELELCRDDDLLPPTAESGEGKADSTGAVKDWRCLHCSHLLPRNAIEEHLIAEVEAMVVAWSTQDLRCGKCGSVRVEACDFMEHCPCSGNWVATLKMGEVREKLGVLEGVARVHSMKMLGMVLEEVMREI